MRDARYLRAQAELCLEMALQMSDQAASDDLRAEAAAFTPKPPRLKLACRGEWPELLQIRVD